jgi:hypothetical protein
MDNIEKIVESICVAFPFYHAIASAVFYKNDDDFVRRVCDQTNIAKSMLVSAIAVVGYDVLQPIFTYISAWKNEADNELVESFMNPLRKK